QRLAPALARAAVERAARQVGPTGADREAGVGAGVVQPPVHVDVVVSAAIPGVQERRRLVAEVVDGRIGAIGTGAPIGVVPEPGALDASSAAWAVIAVRVLVRVQVAVLAVREGGRWYRDDRGHRDAQTCQ